MAEKLDAFGGNHRRTMTNSDFFAKLRKAEGAGNMERAQKLRDRVLGGEILLIVNRPTEASDESANGVLTLVEVEGVA